MSATPPLKPVSTESSSRDALASLKIERPDPSSKRASKKWVWVVVVALLGAGGFYGYNEFVVKGRSSEGSSTAWMPDIMQNRIEVRLASVTVQKGRSADAVVVATGYLESRRQAKIGARAAGRIDVVEFEEGVYVEKGQLLAELEHRDMDASLAAAEATVKRAEAAIAEQEITIEQAAVDKARMERGWKTRSVAESEYDQARFAHRSAIARLASMESDLLLAEAQMEQTKQLRENMYIRAPFAGTVISKDAEVGESILPGGMGGGSGRGSVATIADLEHLEIVVDVQEDFISRVKEGQEADIAVDAVPDKKYRGKVRKIIPMGDRARATIKVKVEIIDADDLLFPEMAGTVFFIPKESTLEASEEPRFFCKSTAVDSDQDGNQFVWIVDEQKRAKKLPVKTGEDRDGKTELLEGVEGRERVVVNPEDLFEGTPVTIAD